MSLFVNCVSRWLLLRSSGRVGPRAGRGMGQESAGRGTSLSGEGRGCRRGRIRWASPLHSELHFPWSHGPWLSCVFLLCSEEASDGSPAISAVQREKTLLNGMIQKLLPSVGPSVRSLSLAYSAAVSSKMVRTCAWNNDITRHEYRRAARDCVTVS